MADDEEDTENLNSLTPEGIREQFDKYTDAQFMDFIVNYFEAEFDEGNYISERLKAIRNLHLAVEKNDPLPLLNAPEPDRWSTDELSRRARTGRRAGDSHLRLVRNNIQEGTEEET